MTLLETLIPLNNIDLPEGVEVFSREITEETVITFNLAGLDGITHYYILHDRHFNPHAIQKIAESVVASPQTYIDLGILNPTMNAMRQRYKNDRKNILEGTKTEAVVIFSQQRETSNNS